MSYIADKVLSLFVTDPTPFKDRGIHVDEQGDVCSCAPKVNLTAALSHRSDLLFDSNFGRELEKLYCNYYPKALGTFGISVSNYRFSGLEVFAMKQYLGCQKYKSISAMQRNAAVTNSDDIADVFLDALMFCYVVESKLKSGITNCGELYREVSLSQGYTNQLNHAASTGEPIIVPQVSSFRVKEPTAHLINGHVIICSDHVVPMLPVKHGLSHLDEGEHLMERVAVTVRKQEDKKGVYEIISYSNTLPFDDGDYIFNEALNFVWEILCKPYSPESPHQVKFSGFGLNGSDRVIYRPNHNGVHALTRLYMLELILKSLRVYAKSEILRNHINELLSNKQLLNALKTLSLFISVGRFNEASREDDIIGYSAQKNASGRILYEFAKEYFPEDISGYVELIKNVCNPGYFKMHEGDMPGAMHFVLSAAHDFVLLRCYGPSAYHQATAVKYRPYWFGEVAESEIEALQNHAKQAHKVVGVELTAYPGEDSKNKAVFALCSSYNKICQYLLGIGQVDSLMLRSPVFEYELKRILNSKDPVVEFFTFINSEKVSKCQDEPAALIIMAEECLKRLKSGLTEDMHKVVLKAQRTIQDHLFQIDSPYNLTILYRYNVGGLKNSISAGYISPKDLNPEDDGPLILFLREYKARLNAESKFNFENFRIILRVVYDAYLTWRVSREKKLEALLALGFDGLDLCRVDNANRCKLFSMLLHEDFTEYFYRRIFEKVFACGLCELAVHLGSLSISPDFQAVVRRYMGLIFSRNARCISNKTIPDIVLFLKYIYAKHGLKVDDLFCCYLPMDKKSERACFVLGFNLVAQVIVDIKRKFYRGIFLDPELDLSRAIYSADNEIMLRVLTQLAQALEISCQECIAKRLPKFIFDSPKVTHLRILSQIELVRDSPIARSIGNQLTFESIGRKLSYQDLSGICKKDWANLMVHYFDFSPEKLLEIQYLFGDARVDKEKINKALDVFCGCFCSIKSAESALLTTVRSDLGDKTIPLLKYAIEYWVENGLVEKCSTIISFFTNYLLSLIDQSSGCRPSDWMPDRVLLLNISHHLTDIYEIPRYLEFDDLWSGDHAVFSKAYQQCKSNKMAPINALPHYQLHTEPVPRGVPDVSAAGVDEYKEPG